MNTTNSGDLASSLRNRREIAVQMQGVSRYFDNANLGRALSNVNLDVRRGEVFGLLGQVGSGKSTAMRILAGRLSPSEGKVKVFGRSPRRRAARARTGYLPQNPDHARSQFIFGTIRFIKDLFTRHERGARPANTAGETGRRERRHSLLQILIKRPDLILLDEPFATMDATESGELKEFIRSHAQQGRTVILCSLSLTHTKDICDRLAVLSRGQIVAVGTLHELLATRDSLDYIGGLLPEATAERALQLIRQDLAASDSPDTARLDSLESTLPGGNTTVAHGISDKHEATADSILAPLTKVATAKRVNTSEPSSTVDHELLATLTKDSLDHSPPQLGGTPKVTDTAR